LAELPKVVEKEKELEDTISDPAMMIMWIIGLGSCAFVSVGIGALSGSTIPYIVGIVAGLLGLLLIANLIFYPKSDQLKCSNGSRHLNKKWKIHKCKSLIIVQICFYRFWLGLLGISYKYF
jgi:hypothetical protein